MFLFFQFPSFEVTSVISLKYIFTFFSFLSSKYGFYIFFSLSFTGFFLFFTAFSNSLHSSLIAFIKSELSNIVDIYKSIIFFTSVCILHFLLGSKRNILKNSLLNIRKSFFEVTVLVYNSTSTTWEFALFYILANSWHCQIY